MAHVRHNLIELIGKRQTAEDRLISVNEISRQSGVPRPTLQYWLDNPKLEAFGAQTITGLCKYFNCTPGDLLEVVED